MIREWLLLYVHVTESKSQAQMIRDKMDGGRDFCERLADPSVCASRDPRPAPLNLEATHSTDLAEDLHMAIMVFM